MKHTEQCESFRRSGKLGHNNCGCWCHNRRRRTRIAAANRQFGSQGKNMKITDFIK